MHSCFQFFDNQLHAPFQTESEWQGGQEKTTASVYICAIQTVIKSHFQRAQHGSKLQAQLDEDRQMLKLAWTKHRRPDQSATVEKGRTAYRETSLIHTNCAVCSTLWSRCHTEFLIKNQTNTDIQQDGFSKHYLFSESLFCFCFVGEFFTVVLSDCKKTFFCRSARADIFQQHDAHF